MLRDKDWLLRQIHELAEALALRKTFEEVRIEHVPRKQNAVADGLANAALDGTR